MNDKQVPQLKTVLKRLRDERGLRQADLARLIGINDSMVAHYETGFRSMSPRTAERTIEALQLSEVDADLLREARRITTQELSTKRPNDPQPDASPAELLERYPVLNMNQTAIVLNLLKRNGQPNRGAVYELIRSDRLRLVDPDQPISRWTVAASTVRHYIDQPSRRSR